MPILALMKNTTKTTRDLTTGINGRGEKIWIVQTTLSSGRVYQETFDNEPEALNWIKWA